MRLEELREACLRGERFKYVLFWGHQPERDGRISKSCFSQWWPATFELDGLEYPTAEHYMMSEKARLFGDEEARSKILSASHPGAAKKFGREVRGFDEAKWESHREAVVFRATLAKFTQHPDLGEFLDRTGEKVLVEASPVDRIWGIGLAADNPAAEDPARWKGLNLLGFALMDAREARRSG